MNNLSWVLYLAGVSDKLGFILGAIALLSLIVTILWALLGAIFASDPINSKDDWRVWRKIGLWLVPICLISFVFNGILPSKETIYAIAAAEMGEQALKTPLAGKAEKALESWLDKQTQENSNAR